MSDQVSLTRKQIKFITDMLEIPDQDRAVERFMEIMLEERVQPALIEKVVDKIMKNMYDKK